MYLRFEDWSAKLDLLDRKGVVHGGRIIKVKATDEDPRERFGKNNLAIIESSGKPFTDDVFNFGKRGIFTGKDLEETFLAKGLNDIALRTVRALVRFSTRQDTGFAYVGMQIKVGSKFLLDHPLDGIHGWKYVEQGRLGQEENLHLDIATSISLGRLKRIVDYDDPSQILSGLEIKEYMRREGRLRIARGKEQ